MNTREKLKQFWNEQSEELKTKFKEIAEQPEWHKLMYVIMETELAKRWEELDEEKINKYIYMAIWFILAQ